MVSQGVESAGSYVGGKGADVVLLHGLGGTWHVWKPIIPILEGSFRVHAVTLPGHLDGPAMPAGVTASRDSLADALMAELKKRGIEQPHLVGNSLGGLMSLELARRGYAKSVTALSPAGAWQTEKEYQAVARPFKIIYAILPILIFLTTLFLRFTGVRKALNKKAMEHGDRVPENECRRAMNSLRQTHILPELLNSMGTDGPIQPMQAGNVPITIAWCEHDQVIPYEIYGKPMIATIEGCTPITIRDVGHVPMYDDPQQVADVILETIRKTEGVKA